MLRINYFKYILMFVLLVLLQVVILNSVSFFSFAIPMVYIYFLLKLPIRFNNNLVLLLGFLLGFVVDVFCNTPGINAAATTFVAFIRRSVMGIYFVFDEHIDEEPAIATLGLAVFMKYAITLIFIHMIALVLLESFSYFNIQLIVLRILSSTVLSSILIFGFEGLNLTSKNSSWRKI